LRGQLVPPDLPLARTRAEQFDDLVLDVVEHLEERWSRELADVEFAVEPVPAVPEDGSEADRAADGTMVEDGGVPLARLLPAGSDGRGRRTPARIVVYRRPLEARSPDRADLADLVHEVVVEQVAALLGRDPDEVDPPEE